mmetsp:Transcript_25803/g.56593  ORF Transcript_25803/g.56593 Transcript_25803/m.56593 type:complete len:218 (+) Transcript_25803:825-1478(+)
MPGPAGAAAAAAAAAAIPIPRRLPRGRHRLPTSGRAAADRVSHRRPRVVPGERRRAAAAIGGANLHLAGVLLDLVVEMEPLPPPLQQQQLPLRHRLRNPPRLQPPPTTLAKRRTNRGRRTGPPMAMAMATLKPDLVGSIIVPHHRRRPSALLITRRGAAAAATEGEEAAAVLAAAGRAVAAAAAESPGREGSPVDTYRALVGNGKRLTSLPRLCSCW